MVEAPGLSPQPPGASDHAVTPFRSNLAAPAEWSGRGHLPLVVDHIGQAAGQAQQHRGSAPCWWSIPMARYWLSAPAVSATWRSCRRGFRP